MSIHIQQITTVITHCVILYQKGIYDLFTKALRNRVVLMLESVYSYDL